MADAERRAFMSHGTRTGTLGVVRADGRPHVRPVWFVLDDDVPVFTTGAGTVKGRSLRRDPRACLVVDDEAPPFSYAAVDGVAEIDDDPDELLRWSTVIARRYMGEDLAESFGRRNAVPGELLVRLRPTRIVSEAGVAD
jgi:PPOX class probable F420-dependent enzyme